MAAAKNYTAIDIERYHSGRMSESEMHAIERAALQDPFLADAIEGYKLTATPAKDIAELNERITRHEKRKQAPVFTLPRLAKIAAMLVLVAGLGYLAYILNTNDHREPLAKKEITNSASEPAGTDSDMLVVLGPPQALPGKNRDTGLSKQPGYKTITDNNLVASNQASEPKDNSVKSLITEDRTRNDVFKADSSASSNLAKRDTLVTAMVPPPGYASKEIILSNKGEEAKQMEHDKNKADESTVMMQQKQERSALKKTAPLREKEQVIYESAVAMPEGGWDLFNDYLQKNMKPNRITGKVVLSFEVRRSGRIHNIKVEESLCNTCDVEATRLLMNGPKWKYASGRQRLNIIF